MNTKWKVLEDRVVQLLGTVKTLKRENDRIKRTNEELGIKAAALEEENKTAKKFMKDREAVKGKVKAILDSIEKAEI